MSIKRAMKKGWTVALLSAGFIALFGSWAVTSAQNKSDFALLNEPGGDTSVQCGARQNTPQNRPIAFTYYVTMANYGAAGFVRVVYADGDLVQYPIPAGGSFSFSQAAGGTINVDDLIRVRGAGGASLVGSISLLTHLNAKPHPAVSPDFCTTSP